MPDTVFGDLIVSNLNSLGDPEAECLGGLEIDDQLELRWLLNREIFGFFAFENSACVNAQLAIGVWNVAAIAH
jgi:hypothetical protein